MAGYLLCLLPFAAANTLGAVLLVALLPGYCFWRAADPGWVTRRLDLRIALAFIASGAVTPLALYWACYGRSLDAIFCATVLLLTCLALLGLATLRSARRSDEPPHAPEPRDPPAISLGLAGITLVFSALILVPWSTNDRHDADMISRSPGSEDWSKHRAFTAAILNTGVPPRNPVLCNKTLAYYYGHHLEAAALVRLSRAGLGVASSLVILSVLLAAATCVLLFHICRGLGGSSGAALAAAALTLFVGGLDIVVLFASKLLVGPSLWNEGHAQVWTSAPRIPFPFSNLHWAPHHHAAALLALAAVWLLASRPVSSWCQVLGGGVLTAGIIVNSVYLGIVALTALGLVVLVPSWRRSCSPGSPRRAVLSLAIAGGVGLALAGGMLWEMKQAPSNESRSLCISLPTLPAAPEVLVLGLRRIEISSLRQVREFQRAVRRPDTPADGPYSWLLSPGAAALVSILAGTLGVVLQLGLVGLLGWLGTTQRAGPPIPAPLLALLASGAMFALLVRNFNLQMRSGALLWLLLGILASRWFAQRRPSQSSPWWRALFVGLCAVGLASLGFEVAGMSRPVYFDAGDVRVMDWARANTPPDAIVQAFPDTHPRIVAMPHKRYFVEPTFPEFTGRCAVMGDHWLVGEFGWPDNTRPLKARLEMAFLANSPAEARQRFLREGVDYVLWTTNEERGPHRGAKRNLLDPEHFDLLYRDGPSFLVRVRQ